MPLPKPNKYDKKEDYISDCMSAQKNEDKPQDQKLAICYSKWESKNESNGLIDIIDELDEELEKD